MENEELECRAKITHETCDGIQPMHLVFYEQSIHYSAERCLNAFARYDSMIDSDEAYELISAVQEAIGHSAALSRYFWPTSMGKKKEIPEQLAMRQSRGLKLKKIFGVTDDSPIANRDIRNAWEHFDEKLDTYLISNDAGLFFPSPMIAHHAIADEPTGKVFKLIDPTNEVLILLDKRFFYRPIRDEVERIFKKSVV
ncbi:hypothetical protein [Marinomonas sp.]|uniref:hypothetical protein n=1 Tax=Marinomonas sp. TaxID=1904862 RepID=UPI003BA8465F